MCQLHLETQLRGRHMTHTAVRRCQRRVGQSGDLFALRCGGAEQTLYHRRRWPVVVVVGGASNGGQSIAWACHALNG